MKRLILVFVIGIAVGASVMGVSGQHFLPGYQSPAPTIAGSTIRSYEDKYVACIIDEIHLGLLLRATCPELVPDWLEGQISDYGAEFAGPLGNSTVATNALYMIEAFYTRTGRTMPREIEAVLEKRRWHFCATNIKSRLSHFDQYMTIRESNGTFTNDD